MSLAIDQDKVSAVLLPSGWYEVAFMKNRNGNGKLISTFFIDAFEIIEYPDKEPDERWIAPILLHNDSTGFSFKPTTSEDYISAPISSLLAVATKRNP
jgi:hypothetical protein